MKTTTKQKKNKKGGKNRDRNDGRFVTDAYLLTDLAWCTHVSSPQTPHGLVHLQCSVPYTKASTTHLPSSKPTMSLASLGPSLEALDPYYSQSLRRSVLPLIFDSIFARSTLSHTLSLASRALVETVDIPTPARPCQVNTLEPCTGTAKDLPQRQLEGGIRVHIWGQGENVLR